MKSFEINEEFLVSVTTVKKWNMYLTKENPTPDDLIKAMRGEGECSTTSSSDHEEFTRFREQLGAEGYIKIQRGWWNGDRVVKPFLLNGKKFKKGEQFPCGAAMKTHLKFMK